ncbi:protein serine/threonine phosphatase 2C [Gymnopus androsaceus JB14]|uniref:Protein serine/threonine phosphatase 2C n=1 Tax=Gymnopus androsaceus JB14 TaxID=1447944 RepID=A0A6A4H600_9AGAR|nr:protein serine/threonine phosphatase 2C [Gymnopus androsaceus JB14]
MDQTRSETLNAAFAENCTHSEHICFDNSRVFQAAFQASFSETKPVIEDKTVFFESSLGLIVALFDGHHSDELSEYASQTLPAFLCDRIEKTLTEQGCSLDEAVVASFVKGIEDYDRSLLQRVVDEFPQKDQTDWSDPFWQDEREVFEVLGYNKSDPKFQMARYAVVGTTALIAFIDKAKENIWVASLGDSDAYLGQKSSDGSTWNAIRLSDSHNGDNPREVERMQAEHPGEPPVIKYGRTLGSLAVTRALGNHQLKAPLHLAINVLTWIYPSPFGCKELPSMGYISPPYISATPTVQYHSLKPGDIVVLSSDGLAYELRKFNEDDKSVLMVSLAGATNTTPISLPQDHKLWSEKLGHGFIAPQADDNPAERLIRNVCFGTNVEQMTEVVFPLEQWDDISVLVLQL